MSRRIYSYKEKEIVAGWDRSLRRHFLTIFGPDDSNGEETIVWDSGISVMTPHDVLTQLEDKGIPYPRSLYTDLLYDESYNAGNVIKNYGKLEDK